MWLWQYLDLHLLRRVPLWRGRQLTEKLTSGQSTESNSYGVTQPQMRQHRHILPPLLQGSGTIVKEGQKDCERQSRGGPQGNWFVDMTRLLVMNSAAVASLWQWEGLRSCGPSWGLLEEGKLIFSKDKAPARQTTLRWPHPRNLWAAPTGPWVIL